MRIRIRVLCECCGKVEIICSTEERTLGWDYTGEGAVYTSIMFGVFSPRTCGKCEITKTAYWTIAVEGKTKAELSENQSQAMERIMQEPEILRIDA